MSSFKEDGYVNVATHLGMKARDKSQNVGFSAEGRINKMTLENMYRSEGLAKKIVDIFPTEMTRQWINIEGDPDNLVLQHFDIIDAKHKITNLLRWSRLYGGAIAVLGIDDGGELSDPVNEDAIRSLDFVHVFDRWQVNFTQLDLYKNPANMKFGNPEFYNVFPISTGSTFRVHESRVLRIDGEVLPERLRIQNEGWGDSVLQAPYNELKNLGNSYNVAANIIEDFVQTILSVDNLTDLVGAGEDELVKKRLNLIDYSRSVANTILLDSNEQYSKQASSVAGLPELLDRFMQSLSSVTGIPVSILFGRSAAGMNSTGDLDIRSFYDVIKSEQEDTLKPALERLVRIVMISRDGPFRGREPDSWSIEFNPLWQETKEQKAAFRKTVAETDAIYIDRGVVDPAEIAISRFGGNTFSYETNIDIEGRSTPPPPRQDEMPKPCKTKKEIFDEKYLEVLEKLARDD